MIIILTNKSSRDFKITKLFGLKICENLFIFLELNSKLELNYKLIIL